ncbi:MAG: glycosyltransferase family 4 protein [Dehalococcoidia bacterium]|nr:glycosyltransferase family 4 protein [Dehalococcoidia bacterium]
MKIALVSPYDYAYPGGVVVHISYLYEQLIKMGHNVKIITPCSNKEFIDSQDVIALGKPFPVPSGGSIARATLSPALSSPVRAILERERFDIIHLHEPLGSTLPLTVLRVSQSVNVGTFHACHLKPRGYRIMSPFVMGWFNKLDGKIAVSKPAMEFISKHFPGDYKIIPNGIDVEHFSADVPTIERFRDGKLNILFIGRMEKRKGLRYLLGAYKKVKSELPNTRLIVVGPGDIGRHEKLVRKANLEDVVFTGYVPNEDLPIYYHTADLFCAPATGEESFGIILLEAMAAAKPIVASEVEGYASVMNNGAQGLLVPPQDEQALATALIRLLSDKHLRQEMGARGRLKVEEYGWQNITRRVVDYYASLLNGS